MDAKRGFGFRDSSISRKGQVTVFIIIGIIMLFSFAAILYVTQRTVREELTAEGEPIMAQVPQEFAPLQSYTENCLRQVGKRGLLILGEQGGYIYPELVGEYSSANPSARDGIDLEPLQVPYWHYNKEPNTATKITFASLQPRLYAADDSEMSIEAQLARFAKEKLDSCLNGYDPFAGQGFQVEVLSPPRMDVRVGDESVNFWLQMEVKASRGEAEHTFEEFYVKIPLRLKHYYEVAGIITQAQQEHHFLERQGIELISVYSNIDPGLFPPTSDVTYDLFSAYSWNENELKRKFTGLLASYVPMLRFLGSENFYQPLFPENRIAQKIVDNMVIPLPGAEDVSVTFDYYGWEPYFRTNSESGIIKPEHILISSFGLTFGQQRYDTHYDASYPVLVTLHDDTALGGEGFSFVFSMESNIRNNNPAVEGERIEPYPRAISSLACDEAHRNTEILKTVVVDSFTHEPVELVKVGFSIPEQADCDMGMTNSRGEVQSRYPAAYGGVINFIHPEYLTNFYPVDTIKLQDDPARDEPLLVGYAVAGIARPEKVMEMHKTQKIKATVRKKNINKCLEQSGIRRCFGSSGLFSAGEELLSYKPEALSSQHSWFFSNSPQQLEPSEEAIITLTLVRGLAPEVRHDEFTAALQITGNQEGEIELVPGVYEVSGMIISNEPLTIPEEKRCVDPSIFTFEKCFTLEETVMEKQLSGQLQWDLPETYLTITPEELYTSDSLQLYVPALNLEAVPAEEHVRIVDDLQASGQLGNFSQILRSSLEPRFR